MIQETKDSIANATTIAGAGSAYMGWNEALTLLLIVTGIVLNVVRIVETRRKTKQDEN